MDELCTNLQRPALRILYYCGLNPTEPHFGLFLFTILLHITGSSLMLLKIIFMDYETFEDFIKSGIIFTFVIHCPPILEMLVKRRNNLRSLFENKYKFWSPPNKEVGEEIEEVARNYQKQMWGQLFGMAACVLIALPVKLYWGNSLVEIYRPEMIPEIVMDVLTSIFQAAIVILSNSSSCMFCSIVVPLMLQFKLLNKSFETMFDRLGELSEEECVALLKANVDHHNFLMSQVKLLNATFGPVLLLKQWNFCIFMSLLLFQMSHSAENLDPMTIAFVMVVIWILFFGYFMPSQQLTDEASKLSQSIFNSRWPEFLFISNKKNRKILLLLVQLAQQDVEILAGNLVGMNLQTCTNLFKSMLSYRTFLSTFT